MGDQFVLANHSDIDDVFVLSNMTAEVYRTPSGSEVIGFNGTTEWALDSVEQQETLWLPRESQLRGLLGGTLRELRQVPAGWVVEIEVNGRSASFTDFDAEEAYGLALLHLVLGRW